MSAAETAARATQWLQDLINELPGLRNATSRDPGFKNWRQNAITTLQRIWPADQDHAERFRRIPFSPVDPRADTRAQRESFSRGCQEAARVLAAFIQEIHTQGVPQSGAKGPLVTEESGFEDGFPTVDFPSGDLGEATGADEPRDGGLGPMPPQGADPGFVPPPLRVGATGTPHVPSAPPAPAPADTRPKSKGLNVAAKLRDLLGLSGFAAKTAAPAAPQQPMDDAGVPPGPLPRALDIIPVGDEVDTQPRATARPTLKPAAGPTAAPGSRGAASTPAAGPAPEPPARTPGAPPAGTGMSVVMSRPTTLRSSIEKVSIESLISPEFRSGAESGAAHATPAAPAAPAAQAPGRPPLSVVPPRSNDPEPGADPDPATPPETATDEAVEPAPASSPDSAELARATADFMRSSPVLGATGRKVQRPAHEATGHGFTEPDAIAIVSMLDELTQMGVPATRQSETRARLVDLARRMESDELEWNALRKAVWFAMEYPEVARRLVPLLLPWIDRAA